MGHRTSEGEIQTATAGVTKGGGDGGEYVAGVTPVLEEKGVGQAPPRTDWGETDTRHTWAGKKPGSYLKTPDALGADFP